MRVIYKGKAIEIPDSQARLLVKNGRASWPKGKDHAEAVEEVPKVVNKVVKQPTAMTTKRAYKRRDMRSEK